MKIFHCDHCGQLVFFENVRCGGCGHALAFLPDEGAMGALEQSPGGQWRSTVPRTHVGGYRLCQNYERDNICNWAVPVADPNPFCASCRLTRVIPDLSWPAHKDAWFRLESAKRRLIYTLLALKLPLTSRADDPASGLAFEFLADSGLPGPNKVLTGHDAGVITLNIAEADDSQREKNRAQMHEPYRTLLGHFRHEIGHYYWDRLIAQSPRIEAFRACFGDERADYAAALQHHYYNGPVPDWQQRFISAYASSHPWEDWAETWAHYLHMADTLETATECGLALRPKRPGGPKLATDPHAGPTSFFGTMIEEWFPITFLLNSLNRGLGLPDAYPFVLSDPVIQKLRFVHKAIRGS